MKNEQQTKIVIVWDRESGEARFDLMGLSHVEAQRLLQGVLQANLENALREAGGAHEGHGHDPHPSPLPEGEGANGGARI